MKGPMRFILTTKGPCQAPRAVTPEDGCQAVRGTSDDKTSWFNGSVVRDSYRPLALAFVLRTISRFCQRAGFPGLGSDAWRRSAQSGSDPP